MYESQAQTRQYESPALDSIPSQFHHFISFSAFLYLLYAFIYLRIHATYSVHRHFIDLNTLTNRALCTYTALYSDTARLHF
jgi:hypothetical protein